MRSFYRTLCPALLLCFFFFSCILRPVSSNIISDLLCRWVQCGEGKCVASNATLFGFDCECNAGWKQIEIDFIVLPPCIVPNCTLNLDCGNDPPPPPPPPVFNISNPCSYTFCGDGTCLLNGTGHICDCNDGASNFLNVPGFLCIRECAFGADCHGFGFGPLPPPPPPPMPVASHSGAPKEIGVGFTQSENISMELQRLTMLLFLTIFVPWITIIY